MIIKDKPLFKLEKTNFYFSQISRGYEEALIRFCEIKMQNLEPFDEMSAEEKSILMKYMDSRTKKEIKDDMRKIILMLKERERKKSLKSKVIDDKDGLLREMNKIMRGERK